MPKNKTTVEAPLQTLSSRAEPSDLRFHLTRSQALPQPVHLRQSFYPLGSPQTLCPSIRFCSRPGSSLLYQKPLCPPPLSH
jgi:hypothetical protein